MGHVCNAHLHLAKVALTKQELDKALGHANRSVGMAEQLGQNTVLKDLYQTLITIHSERKDFEGAFMYHTKLDSREKGLYGSVQQDNIAREIFSLI